MFLCNIVKSTVVFVFFYFIVFIILILGYAILLNRLDDEYSGETSPEDVTPTTGKVEE